MYQVYKARVPLRRLSRNFPVTRVILTRIERYVDRDVDRADRRSVYDTCHGEVADIIVRENV